MSGSEWNELEKAWQSLPASAQPVVDELERRHKWRWLTRLNITMEILLTLGGVLFGFWISANSSVLVGGIVLVYVALSGALTYWARSIPLPRIDEPIALAAAAAVRHAEIAVRIAAACRWTVVGGMAFIAVLSLLGDFGMSFRPSLLSIGVALVWLCVVFVGSELYCRKRSEDLARLRTVQETLKSDV